MGPDSVYMVSIEREGNRMRRIAGWMMTVWMLPTLGCVKDSPVTEGSYVEAYCKENGIPFRYAH